MHKKLKDTYIDHMYSTMHVSVQECIEMCELAMWEITDQALSVHVGEWAWQEE